jgi:signal transduction histidine kinase
LTTIQGNLDLLRLYGNDPRSLVAIEGEVKRMSRLVGDLLLLAQADAGQLPMEMEPLELDQLILEISNEAVILSKGKHILRLGRLDQVVVNGNPDRLKQLFLNLVSNAIKYTPEQGTITLSLTQEGNLACVSVTDTGMGIPEEDLKHIFDRFYRVDKARSRAAGGTGLGLSIAKWLAEAHGGKILVESQVNRGTTFTVVLPIAGTKPADEDELHSDPPSARFIPMRMLK